jgi:hypothetical protein
MGSHHQQASERPLQFLCSPECRCPTNHKALLTGIEGDLRKSGEPENPRRRWRYVDNATAHERTTIVDGDKRDVIPMFNPEYRDNTFGKGALGCARVDQLASRANL